MNLESGAGPSATASKYAGAELRVETDGGLAYVVLAADTAGVVNVANCRGCLAAAEGAGHGSLCQL